MSTTAVPIEKYSVEKPVFFGAALEDYAALDPNSVGMDPMDKASLAKYCKNATIREFKANHWLTLQAPDKVNKELLSWIEGL